MILHKRRLLAIGVACTAFFILGLLTGITTMSLEQSMVML